MNKHIEREARKSQDNLVVNAITIDCVIFGFDDNKLEVLLVKHGEGIRKGKWGLPGGWLKEEEGIDSAANRLLKELTGIDNLYLEQLKAFGEPDRFPLGRVITIGYYALIKKTDYNIKAGYTASDARWCAPEDVGKLIYDHNDILNYSIEYLRRRVRHEPIGFNLLPEKFTLFQLMHLYQNILGVTLDKSNFRRKILRMKLLIDLGEKERCVSHRAAKLFQFDPKRYKELTKQGFNFEV
ncbi:MAG: NUDIX hydrolase [Bacteroidales bacterium]